MSPEPDLSDLDLSEFPLRYARRVLLTCLVLVGAGQTVLFSVLAPLGREVGLTEIQVGFLLSCSSVTVFLTVPIWGRLSDTYGRKRIMLIGMFGYTLGTALFASIFHAALIGLIVGIPAFIALVVSRVMHASVMSATMPASSAYMADITTPEQRTKGMGAVGAANNIGAILGPAVGAGFAVISLLSPLWIAAAAIFITAVVTTLTLPEVPKRQFEGSKPPKISYFDPRILSFVIVGVLMFTGFAIVQNTMAFRMQDALQLTGVETARMFGTGMICVAVSSLFSQGILVQLLELKPFSLLRLAMPILIGAFYVMATYETQFMLLGSMVLLGLGMGLAGPGFMAGASLAVSAEEQGAIAGIAGSCPPMGFTIGPLLGTVLYTINPTYPYLFAVVVFCFLLVFVMVPRKAKR